MKPRRKHIWVRHVIYGLSLSLVIPCSVSLAQEATPITSSGLNTTVSAPITLPSGETQFDITGGTRPGGGGNLFHSFGTFDVPNNNVANFLNNSGLATSNILGRVTGGNMSDIFGTIQTTGFGNANLFLMNPAGFLFGPNATVNVGGMVTFTSADYLRLADNARFNAVPRTAPDLLLSTAPIVAFGFLGSHPGAITVQGSQLSVAEGTDISLVGGNITVQAGTLTAPSGQINLVSVAKPSHSKTGGEVTYDSEFAATGFKSLGAITLSQGSTVDASAIESSVHPAGKILIRGGQFVMDASAIEASTPRSNLQGFEVVGGSVEVTAKHTALSNHSIIDVSVAGGFIGASAGDITFNVGTLSAIDSTIVATGEEVGGPVTIQGLQGSGTHAQAVSLTNTAVTTSCNTCGEFQGVPAGGAIVIQANRIALNQSNLNASAAIDGGGGAITLESRGRIESHNSSLITAAFFGSGGTVNVKAGARIDLSGTIIDAHSGSGTVFASGIAGGAITMAAPVISIRSSNLNVSSGGTGHGGTISLTGTKAVNLTDGTLLSADNFLSPFPLEGSPPTANANGGTIHIDGGAKVTSEHGTLSATSRLGNGGTIQIEANKVRLTDTQVTTSVSGGPQTVGGSITVDAKNVQLKNSEILSTATEGQGGTIDITSHNRHPVINSVLDATSQFGTDGTVTIERR